MIKKQSVFILFLCTFILSGCFGPSPEENIYQLLEEAASLEDTFKQQQKPLLELEKKESELYEKIMDLGMTEFDQVVTLSKEALTVIEDREKKIKTEHESIMASKEKFEEVTAEIKNIKDENIRDAANQLKTTMEDRYKSYETLFENYENSLSLDKELYTMLQKKDLTIEEFDSQLTKVNAAYKTVIQKNNEFNKLTEQFNEQKIEFYKKAELNVEIRNE